MEHKPWVGSNFEVGINGTKIAILGNSHWLSDDEVDHEDASIEVIKKVISKEYNIAFFNQIRDYFGFRSHADFWQNVMFMNYAPHSIGTGGNRFDHMTPLMAEKAKARLGKIMSSHLPDKVFVFSKKIRWSLPPMVTRESPHPSIETGEFVGHLGVTIHLLRHPQGAKKSEMLSAVKSVMA